MPKGKIYGTTNVDVSQLQKIVKFKLYKCDYVLTTNTTLGLSKTTENQTHLKDPSRNRINSVKWQLVANWSFRTNSTGSSLGFSPPKSDQTNPTHYLSKLRLDLNKSSKISPNLVRFPLDSVIFQLVEISHQIQRDLTKSNEIYIEFDHI